MPGSAESPDVAVQESWRDLQMSADSRSISEVLSSSIPSEIGRGFCLGFGKRCVDLIPGRTVFVLPPAVLLVSAIATKLHTPAAVLYRSVRAGWGGKPFVFHKLPLMNRGAEEQGITCLWQIGGRSRLGFDEWMRLAMRYLSRCSLVLDAKILLRTIPAVLLGKGA